ncbi:MAG: UDP-N-acetylglucosamine 2-epimerase (non-hydrolyzing) [Crocinitomicaceae bacterium]|jgi:UDP-N-acetylglucosamine 2-epimerase (non-hydrolysing)|nr:UDP-N-acetylglucosamine 2-epimerase (non-hydrolyzing) [Crocinitomicaceae bacterium]
MNKKIDLIVGARPNFIKAFPVYDALEKTGKFQLRLINTGQHYDANMANIFFHQMKMKQPDVDLLIGSGTHAEQTGKIMLAIEKEFLASKPDLVMVFGDINSTVAASLAAVKLHIPVAHVEAGLRSFDRDMPEEINRVITDQISDLLFITSPEAKNNLLREGKKESQIFFVGNTMIDSLVKFEQLFDGQAFFDRLGTQLQDYILVTIHRPSNLDDPRKFHELIDALNRISEEYSIIWPIHPRTKKVISENNTKLNTKVHATDPLGYLEFMGLQKNAKKIITDSGGVQEESTYFGVPCYTVRDNTERPITISQGTNVLTGTDFVKLPIIVLDDEPLPNNEKQIPNYWDGKSSERILKHLFSYF